METARNQPELRSQRLLLRPFVMQDADELFPLINDKEIAANTRTIPYPYPEDGAAKWIETHELLWSEGKSAIFAVCEIESGNLSALRGAIGLEIDAENEHAELGYWIGRDFWNKGFCSEACASIVEFGFTDLALQRIHAHHLTRNPASGRVLENIGMKREGVLRKHIKKWGVFEDIAFFGILREEWSRR